MRIKTIKCLALTLAIAAEMICYNSRVFAESLDMGAEATEETVLLEETPINITQLDETENEEFINILYNRASIIQLGDQNISEIYQYGLNNQIEQFQQGFLNYAYAEQNGFGNRIYQTEIGDRNYLSAKQFGDNNILTQYIQGSGHESIIEQHGDGKELHISYYSD